MQVSPDKNVRVTETKSIGRIPVSPEHAAGLSDGDFLVAKVEQVRGDTLLLRAEGGVLLNAALQGNMSLAEGDVIEAAVSKEGGICLLYIVNVLHTGGQNGGGTEAAVSPQTLSALLSVIKRNPGLDADIALYLAQNNIPDTAENIAALSQMSRGTGIGALLGQVLGLLVQEAKTAQKGDTLSPAAPTGDTVSQGGPLAARPDAAPRQGQPQRAGMAQDQATVGGQPQTAPTEQGTANRQAPLPKISRAADTPPQTAAAGTNPAPGTARTDTQQAASVPVQSQGAQGQVNTSDGTVTATVGTQAGEPSISQGPMATPEPPQARQDAAGTAQPQQNAANTAQPRQNADKPTGPQTAVRQDSAGAKQPQAAPPQGAPVKPGEVPAEENRQNAGQNLAAQAAARGENPQANRATGILNPIMQEEPGARTPQGQEEQIGRLIRGFFLQPEEHTGKEVKRRADEMSRGLKTLKSELIQTDNKYRELFLKSVDQALRQIELADRAARFEHMQIPIAFKEGEHRTAELFVFRRKNGRKGGAAAGRSILVALDTDHMGRVETLIREESGSISLEFRLQNPDMTENFKQHSEPLRKTVEAAGYRLSGMRFAGLEKKTTVLNAGEMAPLDAGSVSHGIDVQI